MELIVDANILVSRLIKDGITRELMMNNELELYTSDFIFIELFKHIKEIAKKADMDKKELKELAEILVVESGLEIVTKEQVKSFIKLADKISPDPDDMLYFATALKLDCAIWSNDKELKKHSSLPFHY